MATPEAPAGPPGPADHDEQWRSLYAGGRPPAETGVGAATVARKRRRRRTAWWSALAALVVAGIVAYFTVPAWWYSPKAYMDHLGYGPYEGEMPAALHQRLGATMPGLISFVERERGHRFAAAPAVVFLPDKQFESELRAHDAFAQWHYVGAATYDALGWAHTAASYDKRAVALHGDDVVAYYGDWDGTIYLRGTRLTNLAKAEIVALLTRSLDEQTFNIQASLYNSGTVNFDERVSYDALVQGDARYVQRQYIESQPQAERCALLTATQLPVDAGCPAPDAPWLTDPLQAEIKFADVQGLKFITGLRESGGNRAVDAAMSTQPPRSTADIISLAHYRKHLNLRVVDFPAHTGTLVDFGSLGAYTLSLALAHGNPRQVTDHLVKGWWGDSFSTAKTGGKTCVWDAIVFVSPADAAAFARQARDAGITVTRDGPADAATARICH